MGDGELIAGDLEGLSVWLVRVRQLLVEVVHFV
jgi:hypothetical protein